MYSSGMKSPWLARFGLHGWQSKDGRYISQEWYLKGARGWKNDRFMHGRHSFVDPPWALDVGIGIRKQRCSRTPGDPLTDSHCGVSRLCLTRQVSPRG